MSSRLSWAVVLIAHTDFRFFLADSYTGLLLAQDRENTRDQRHEHYDEQTEPLPAIRGERTVAAKADWAEI